jgi:hypothetical protein
MALDRKDLSAIMQVHSYNQNKMQISSLKNVKEKKRKTLHISFQRNVYHHCQGDW